MCTLSRLATAAPTVRAALCAVCVAALLAALGSGAARASERETRAALIGHGAPDFTLRALSGGAVRLSDHIGDVVVGGFWTSGCGTCRAELQRLERLHATYASAGLAVIGVSLDDDEAKAAELASAVKTTFRSGFDAAKACGPNFHVNGVPLTVLIDRGGVVRYVHGEIGRQDELDLVDEIRRLLDE
jgi:peroxiredoxin